MLTDSKKIDFSIGALTTLNAMKEDTQDSVLASLARVASHHFNTLKIQSLNPKENTFVVRTNNDFSIVFKIQNDTIIVNNILSNYLIKSYQEALKA